jgi:hypothetical protein
MMHFSFHERTNLLPAPHVANCRGWGAENKGDCERESEREPVLGQWSLSYTLMQTWRKPLSPAARILPPRGSRESVTPTPAGIVCSLSTGHFKGNRETIFAGGQGLQVGSEWSKSPAPAGSLPQSKSLQQQPQDSGPVWGFRVVYPDLTLMNYPKFRLPSFLHRKPQAYTQQV